MTTLDELLEQIREQRDAAQRKLHRATASSKAVLAAARAAGRSRLTPAEDLELEGLLTQRDAAKAELGKIEMELRAAQKVADEEAEVDRLSEIRVPVSGGVTTRARPRNPLAFHPESLDQLQGLIDSRTAARVEGSWQERATLVTGTLGAGRDWGANVLSGPRLLHVAAGVPQQQVDAVYAQHPVLTLPTASAGVGEGVAVGEYASSTAGSVTLAKFGRWTDLSRESQIGADADAIVGMHQIGIGRDLDKVLIDAVETAAGAAVAFTTDVPAAIRKAMAQVIDNTAAESASDLVILVHPDNAALLQDVSPIGGQTMAEGFQKFSGALVYPSSAVDTGFMTVANLRAGARFFQAQGILTETDVAVKTSVLTVATVIIAGYGLTLNGGATGAFVKVDVVTP